jgi:hypothetical protein
VVLVSDYILPSEVGSVVRNPKRVVYNPAKGEGLVRRVIGQAPELEFVALKGYGREALFRVVAEAGCYLDLGHQPGRDRLPREASLVKTPIVVARRGAARYPDDCPLADDYLVDATDVASVHHALSSVTNDVEAALQNQQTYREWAASAEARFNDEVRHMLDVLG